MKMPKTLHMKTRGEWRAWLEKNHDREKELWLIFYKKHTGEPNISYSDALDEALCFGWVDSLVQRIDDEKFGRKFTPRNLKSQWSEVNRRRVAKLIREGHMTAAGRAKIDFDPSVRGPDSRKASRQLTLPPELMSILAANQKAVSFFNQLAPSYRQNYIGWILEAKKEETRIRRLNEAIRVLERNEKLGMK